MDKCKFSEICEHILYTPRRVCFFERALLKYAKRKKKTRIESDVIKKEHKKTLD